MLTTELWNGVKMPIVGLGTFKLKGPELVEKVIKATLQAGYRSFDTASVYRNENDIGIHLTPLATKYKLERSDIFITSKLGPKDHGSEGCRKAFFKSLSNLRSDYLDLYLIHWPGAQGMQPDDPRNKALRKESWLTLEQLYDEGKVKAIGVSNYTLTHLKEVLGYCTIKPHVLQIEHHPHLIQGELLEFCKHQGIHYQAYSSLGTTTDENKLLKDETVHSIASSHNKSDAQILLRWAVQQQIGVLPKSTNVDHVKENIDIFDFNLSDEEMCEINLLNVSKHYCWNPEKVL